MPSHQLSCWARSCLCSDLGENCPGIFLESCAGRWSVGRRQWTISFLWRQLRYCSVQIFCGNTFSTMIYLLPSWQPRASSALWGPASSFRSQSQGISPRCGCSDIENLSQLYFCRTGSSTTLYFGVACGVVIIIFWGLLINVFWELTWDSTTYID